MTNDKTVEEILEAAQCNPDHIVFAKEDLDTYYRKKLEKQLIGDWFFDSFFNFIAIEFPGLYENFTREVRLKIIKHLMINIKKVLGEV